MIVAGIDANKTKIAVALLDTESKQLKVQAYTTSCEGRGLQLRDLAYWTQYLTTGAHVIYVEEPVIGRNVRSSLHVAMTAGALAAHLSVPTYFVPVATWKKAVVGVGNANKECVSSWVNTTHAIYAEQCDGDQDLIDATCIALYGAGVQAVAASFSSDRQPRSLPLSSH